MIGEKGADLVKGYLRSPFKLKPGKVKMPKKLIQAMKETDRNPSQTPVQQIFTHLKSKYNLKQYFNRMIKRVGMSFKDDELNFI